MQQVIAKIRKSDVSEIWVVLTDYTGEMRLDLREYFHVGGDKGFLPTKKGISIPVAEIPLLRDALDLLAESAEVGTVARFAQTGKTEIQAGVRKYQGHVFGEVRLFFNSTAGDGEYRPSFKGVTMPLNLVHMLAEAVGEAEESIEKK